MEHLESAGVDSPDELELPEAAASTSVKQSELGGGPFGDEGAGEGGKGEDGGERVGVRGRGEQGGNRTGDAGEGWGSGAGVMFGEAADIRLPSFMSGLLAPATAATAGTVSSDWAVALAASDTRLMATSRDFKKLASSSEMSTPSWNDKSNVLQVNDSYQGPILFYAHALTLIFCFCRHT